MDKIELKDTIKKLLKDLRKVTIVALEQSGVRRNSDLSKSVMYIGNKDNIRLEVNYYYPFVSDGRRPGVRKVPIEALIEFIKKNGITPQNGKTINQLAYAIQNTIYKQGINPKNYIDKVINIAGEVSQEEIADGLMDEVADNLVSAFEI